VAAAPSDSDPGSPQADGELRLPAGARRRIAQRAALALVAVSAAAVAAAFLATAPETGGPAPVLLGHAAAQLVTLSWVVGALWAFDAEGGLFMGSTVGLAPFRLLVVAGLLAGGSELFDLPLVPMGLSLVLSYGAGHAVEIYVFEALARAASASGPRDP